MSESVERDEIHIGDIGTSLGLIVKEAGVIVDIGAATNLKMRFKKPSGTVVEKTAVLLTDGSDGIMRYVSTTGDLDEAGWWMREGFFTLGTWTGATDKVRFYVAPILETE